MERTILHIDLNNFFASVSLLFNQTLVGSPVAVCGSVEHRHGIVLAKNEIAKAEAEIDSQLADARKQIADLKELEVSGEEKIAAAQKELEEK